MQLMVILILLIILAATGLFLLLFSVSLASSIRLIQGIDNKNEKRIQKNRSWVRLLRMLGIFFLVIPVVCVFVVRSKNNNISDVYVQIDEVSQFTDGEHTAFSYKGASYVHLDEPGKDAQMTDYAIGDALVNVRDTDGVGRFSDLGCKILNINPYETMYRAECDCPVDLLFGYQDGFYVRETDFDIASEYFQRND